MSVLTLGRRATVRRRVGGLRGLGVPGTVAAVLIVAAILFAVFGPLLTSVDPNAGDVAKAYAPPEAGHLLGFDGQGRDLFARLVTGARTSLLGPVGVVVLGMTAGTVIAIASVWAGGWLDSVTSSVLEVLFAFPGVLLAMLVAAVFGAGLDTAILALAVAYIPYIARLLRGAALAERGKGYVQALEVQGAGAMRSCLRHLVPNLLPVIATQATLFFGYAMVDLAIISFFGLGVRPPDADWGVMVSDGQSGVLQGYPAESLLSGGCIVVLVIAFNILGERMPGHRPASRPWRLRPGGSA